MIRTLLKVAAVAIVAILVYNRFFGTDEEKTQSKKIFGEMRDVVVSVGQLIKSEKAKFDAGKYDAALDKLGDAYRAVRDRAEYVDEKIIKRLDELEQRKAQLKKELDALESSQAPAPAPKKGAAKENPSVVAAKEAEKQRKQEALTRELERLIRDSDSLLQQAQEQ